MLLQVSFFLILLIVMIYALVEVRKLRVESQSLKEKPEEIDVKPSKELDVVVDSTDSYPEIESLPVPGSSLAMVSFNDFLDRKNLELRRAQELKNADNTVRKMLKYAGVSGLPASGVQIVDSIRNIAGTDEFAVVFTKEARRGLKSGELRLMAKKGTDHFKSVLVSNETGKITNLADLVPKTRAEMATKYLSNAASGVIAIAHIISNYDMSVKIKEISKKLDHLIEGRLIDKKARLMAIYYHLQHIMRLEPAEREIQMSFLSLVHKELMELRYNWLMEIVHELNSISDDRNWFYKLVGLGHEGQATKNRDKVCALDQKILLIDACYKVDSMVCAMTGLKVNVEHELEEIRNIRAALDNKYTEFKNESFKMKTQEEMNQLFDMLEYDCKTMFDNTINENVLEAKYSLIGDNSSPKAAEQWQGDYWAGE
jgi:hypothetical protein